MALTLGLVRILVVAWLVNEFAHVRWWQLRPDRLREHSVDHEWSCDGPSNVR
jgi:hypothetical protein